MEALCQIESGCRDDAVSFRGAKYGRGRYQISEIALKHFNQSSNITPFVKNYTDGPLKGATEFDAIQCFQAPCVGVDVESLHDKEINYFIANWYLNWIENALRINGIEPTVEKILACWNFGYGNVIRGKKLPKETQDFLKKYEELTREESHESLQLLRVPNGPPQNAPRT